MKNTKCKGCDNMSLVEKNWTCSEMISVHMEKTKTGEQIVVANKKCDLHTGMKAKKAEPKVETV